MKHFKYYFGVFLIILLGALLRFFMLQDKSLWLDEGYSLYYSEGSSFQEIISRLLGTDTGDRFQPLYYLLLYYWRQLFGSTEFAVRSLSAFLGINAIIILFFTSLQLYGKKHAIWMAFFLSVSSYAVYYSQQTRAYAMLLFLAALQFYFFSKALNTRQTKGELISRWLFWIVTAFSLFCSVFIGIFTLSLCLSHILIYKNPKRWLQWWLPAAIFCIPAILFYLASPVATEPTKVNVTLSRQPVIQNLVFVLYGLLVGETYGPPIEQLRTGNKFQILLTYLPQLLILTGVVGIFLLFFLRRWRLKSNNDNYQKLDNFFGLLFIITLAVATLFAIVTNMNWLPRHSFYIYIPLTFLLPVVVRKIPGVTSRKSQTTFNYAQIALIAILIVNIYSVGNYYFNRDYEREDYRVIAQYLSANQGVSVKSILLYGAPNLLPYYGDTKTLNGLSLDTSNLAEDVKSISNDANKVLIAISFQDFWEFKKNFSLQKSMSSLYKLQSKVSFTNFNIYQYIKK
jgi:uncharacterized membrane protein